MWLLGSWKATPQGIEKLVTQIEAVPEKRSIQGHGFEEWTSTHLARRPP